MPLPKISIIGTGNLAYHLSKSLERAGLSIEEVYGRNMQKASILSEQLYVAKPTDSVDFSESKAKLFMLCVSDDALSEVSQNLIVPEEALIVHCSGALPLSTISRSDAGYGVFYPVQTFSSKRKVYFEDLPICIEANSDEAEGLLETLAKKLQANPCFMNSEQRLTLHLAAVFACNFSNHFFAIAKELLEGQGLPFGILNSLVTETVQKALEKGPENSQTGPAVREDYSTMAKHRDLLVQYPEWKELYVKVTQDIIRFAEDRRRS